MDCLVHETCSSSWRLCDNQKIELVGVDRDEVAEGALECEQDDSPVPNIHYRRLWSTEMLLMRLKWVAADVSVVGGVCLP